MVCVRCKMAVQSVLEKLDLHYSEIQLGWVKLDTELSTAQLHQLDRELKFYDLEILENKKKALVERIKTLIIDMLHTADKADNVRFSEYVSGILHYDYTYLSNIYSEMENSTIERFYIEQRIERAKELMIYEGMNVSEIAYALNFSSVSHFCLQFKKVSGQKPAAFKKASESPDFIWRKLNI